MSSALRKCANSECGQTFLPQWPGEKYCCKACCRRVLRLRYRDRVFPHREPIEGVDTIIREFHCKQCDRLVQVCTEYDRRTVFCCPECERKYWKHPPAHRRHGSNNGMSGGMSLGSLIRREQHNLTH